jgi:hypothetical protein
MAGPENKGKWRRVTRANPCPVCTAPDWCSISADGALAACRRVESGCWRSKTDRNGTPVYLHRLADSGGRPPPPSRPPAGPAFGRADPDTLHRAYSALLALLHLSRPHRDALRRRGLSDEEIDRRGYRTLPVRGRARLARDLREHLGDALLSVPGFVAKQGEGGRPYLTIAGAAGLLVPVRDPAGRVVALLVRRDDAGDGRGKYLYLSSARHGGPGPGAPPHVPLGIQAPAETARITEGPLKADVAAALSGLPTVGAAGLAWRPALDVLQALGCKTARLAFDADALDNAHVARALAECCEAAAALGLAVELERWARADGKGIDDLLAAGKAPELLTGEAALAAVREALSAATAGEPPPAPDELDRLAEVLAAGGAPALFGDRPLLAALARLEAADPAAFAARRAALKGLVSLRDLERALAPHRRELRRQQPAPDAVACYRIAGGRIVRDVLTRDGPVEVPLTNWSGRIVEQTVHDDGAERRLTFAVEGSLPDGTPLARADVPADQFPWMRWPVEMWGTRAVVLAGASTADHVRVALQLLSGDVPTRTVYGHTGWRKLGDAWHYLHAGGAIGRDGPAAGVEVSLPGPLAGFALPSPPAGEDLAAAVRASLALLDGLAPDRIMFPLLGAVCRAALGEAPGPIDMSLHLAGPHGVGKSELAALAQQHFGAALDARHLPAGWSSTANALEALAFAAKDALLVVDDYAPRGVAGDRQRLERDADRLLRAQGNRAGRQRMRADGSLRPDLPPRGLILSSGEDVPSGHSLRGRMLVLEVSPSDVPLAGLTPHQSAAAAGRYAEALAAFLRWLAGQYGGLCARLPGERAALRDRAIAETTAGSPRTPAIVADLALGLSLFLDFALQAGALTQADRGALARRGWQALREAGDLQAEHVQAVEPTALFLRLLAAALPSGRAHAAGPEGGPPEAPEAWGWRRRTVGGGDNARDDWQPGGERVGWVDGADLYLEPEVSYAAAQELARDQGEALPVSPRILHRRLKERGLLASWDGRRQRNTVRRALEGVKDREVLHLRSDTLSPRSGPSKPSADPADPPISAEERTVLADGQADGNGVCAGDRPAEPSAKPGENPAGGRFGRSNTGGEAPTGDNRAPHRKRRRGAI